MADGVPKTNLSPAAAPFVPATNVADRDPVDPVAAVTDGLKFASLSPATVAANPDPAAAPANHVPDPVTFGVRLVGPDDDGATWEQLGVEPARIESFQGLVPPWEKPTPVQARTIPSLLQGHDYIVQAPAGQGKTGAFLITALALLARNKGPGPHVVIVTTGQELVDQLKEHVERLDSTVRLCRVKVEPNDMKEAKSSPHGYADFPVLAASIGKLANLLASERGLLKNVKLLVADEAHKLLNDFTVDFNKVVEKLPRDCQRTFWSATIDDRTEKALRPLTRDPRSTQVQRVDVKELLTRNCANYVYRWLLRAAERALGTGAESSGPTSASGEGASGGLSLVLASQCS